jgi:hypothetical protein
MGALALLLTSAVCVAGPVTQETNGGYFVKVGPLTGSITPYDVVDSRFSLRVGRNRTSSGLSQKIPWFAAPGAAVGPELTLTGKALSLPRSRTFTQTFFAAQELGGAQRTMFPSTIVPPSAGCWVFTFKTGQLKARIAVLVRPRPTA